MSNKINQLVDKGSSEMFEALPIGKLKAKLLNNHIKIICENDALFDRLFKSLTTVWVKLKI